MTRIAVLQMTSGIDPAANRDVLVDAAEKAAKGGAAMLFTPEMTGLLDRNRARGRATIVDEASDVVLAAARAVARGHGLWIHIGSLALAGARDDGRLVNRGFVIDASGAIRARYDKIHLFDVDLASGESWRESASYAPGGALSVVETPGGRLGLSVCYDVRFPALYAALSGAGADLLSIPAAFTVPTGSAHWHVLLRARAIENACWVVAAAQTGDHADGRQTFGHSLVVDPWGEVVLDMGQGPGLGFADIDHGRTAEARRRVPVLDHRRPLPPVRVAP
jgi:deaminated glutathione amidase